MDLSTIMAALSMGGGMAQGAPTPAGAMPQTLLPGATGVAPQGIFGDMNMGDAATVLSALGSGQQAQPRPPIPGNANVMRGGGAPINFNMPQTNPLSLRGRQ